MRDNGKSYFVKEIDTGSVFLRNRGKLSPLKELKPDNIAVRRLESFTFLI